MGFPSLFGGVFTMAVLKEKGVERLARLSRQRKKVPNHQKG
jgi:hypothetical protein